MTESLGAHYLSDALARLRESKGLAERAMAQVGDEDFFRALDPESNSIALVVKHMAGNMQSRWTDFLTSDGEKPDRMRDREFEDRPLPRAELMAEWEDGWRRLFDALAPLTDADLQQTVVVRMEPHSVYQAVSRQLAHYAGHVYQILFLGKHLKGGRWTSLSVPKGQSEEFNRKMIERLKARP
jgi:hypothetical protein